MKELLTLCTKNVHFRFNSQVYQQNDGIEMESPLRTVIDVTFMVELDTQIVPI